MSWLQAHVLTDGGHAAQVEAALEAIGALSVTLGDAADEPVLEPAPGETPLWRSTVVTGLFDGAAGAGPLATRLSGALDPALGCAVRIEPLADQVWERAWLEHFRPMRFGSRLWVVPGGQAADLAPGDVAIELDPGLAFGTGTHPSTALCLEWLAGQDLAGLELIDYGCGSGILAVAALKLGAGRAVAIDHDPQALLATRENAARNGVEGRLVALSDLDALPGAAPVVVANILAGTLIDLAPRISALVASGGRLALAGILADQADDVIAAYACRGQEAAPTNSHHTVRRSDPQAAIDVTTVRRSDLQAAIDGTATGRSDLQVAIDVTTTGRSDLQVAIDGTTTRRSDPQAAIDGTATGRSDLQVAISLAVAAERDGWILLAGVRK